MKLKYSAVVAALIAASLLVSCGKSEKQVAAEEKIVEIENEIIESGSSRGVSTAIDSLALNADDLTPAEAVQVLVAYMNIHEQAVADGNVRRDMETLRKYVDVYDIVLSAGGEEMSDAFKNLARRSPKYDFAATAKQYRSILSDYADGLNRGEEVERGESTQQIDSTKTSVATAISE